MDLSYKGRGEIVRGKKSNHCILRSILLPEDFPVSSIPGN